MRRWILVAALACISGPALGQERERAPVLIEDANRAARRAPEAMAFQEATQLFDYVAGALFQLHASPNFVSLILLQPGEILIDRAAGDTANWQVEQSSSGAGPERRTIVLVKPARTGLRTNLVLITDRRIYLIEANAQSNQTYAAQIAWTYPAIARDVEEAQEASAPQVAPALNHNYRIAVRRGARPAWAPLRAYDDGARTWIEFPDHISAFDLPPLFLVTGEGLELVNYRLIGRRYEIDRLFDRAELRLGQRTPVIVRIERRTPNPHRPRRGRP